MKEYRLDKQGLWTILEGWDVFMPRKVRLVACGGTALTIQDLKESTKDVDFLVPDEEEFKAVVQTIKRLGYRQATGSGWARDDGYVFDLFAGKTVFVTELLESPLEAGNHIPIKSFKKITVSALNDYDLVISKMFRGADVDFEDCLRLIRARGKKFEVEKFKARYMEAAQHEVSEERVMGHLTALLNQLKG